AKGFGYIYQRPGSPFLWASYPYRGRQERESTKATTRQGALAFLKARLLEIDSGTYVGRQAEGTTVREVLEDLRRDYEIHKRASFRTITGHIAALNAETGDERCVNVTLPLLNRLVPAWQAYDRETGVVRLPGKDAKTGKPRRIVLAGPLIALMARRIEARKTHPECALIFHRHGKPVRDFRKAWANACTAAGVTGLRFHDLRRTALR